MQPLDDRQLGAPTFQINVIDPDIIPAIRRVNGIQAEFVTA